MLTIELLRQNSALSGLTDAQLQAIAEMSKNDENTVIGTKIGALHGQYDTDILTASGIVKKEGEKSYDYLKRVISEYKTKAESTTAIEAELANQKTLVTQLQDQIEKGAGNEALAQQLTDAKNQVTQLQAQLEAKNTELLTKKSEFDESLKSIHLDYAFDAAAAELKFKAGVTEGLQKTLLKVAKTELLAKGTPDFIESQGKQVLVFRDASGAILNNPANGLNPFTVKELILTTSLKDAIESGRVQPGGGTGAGRGKQQPTSLDLSGFKTQVEADKAIETYLLTSGITRDSQEFAEKSLQLRNENEVNKLPLR